MEEEGFRTLLAFFKVLGNESRLKILGLLSNQEYNVGELSSMLDLKEPTVSHHLTKLRELGLVDMRAERNNRYYRLNSSALETMNKEIFTQQNMAKLVSAPTAGNSPNDRILRTFIVDDQITQIPFKRSKRLVILNWLIEKFEHDREYPEKELNEIIQQYNPDYASLRRYFIEEQLMARERQVYWRI